MWLFDALNASKIKSENEALKKKLEELGCKDYEETKEKIRKMEQDSEESLQEARSQLKACYSSIEENESIVKKLTAEIEALTENVSKLQKQVDSNSNKLSRSRELYKSVDYCIKNFLTGDGSTQLLSDAQIDILDELSPSVILKLHCMDIKDLRKAFRQNDKLINKVLDSYASRYTTKANKTIYSLMVIALRAELQNILYNLKYEKLDTSIDAVKEISAKYLKIAGEGNQSIAGTLTKFIGEIEYLFINAVKIEYNYYVKKEQAKQEQMAIREQMRQEAEERKALEAEKQKIEKEESKYVAEIDKIKEQLLSASDNEMAKLNAKILELQAQLFDVILKKEDITKLQNGKAGNVYIISNLGSFGENIFKIGMTRRLDPQDRVDELGSASVPFRFDVHSFIFSDDAVGLESKLHDMLNDKRVNKVNLRKEFFYSSLDELETLVNEIDPSAEFNKTMLAEEFRQSLSSDEIYSSDLHDMFDDDED